MSRVSPKAPIPARTIGGAELPGCRSDLKARHIAASAVSVPTAFPVTAGLPSPQVALPCGGPRPGKGDPAAGGRYDQLVELDSSAVPTGCDDTGPTGRGVVPGSVHRAHARAVRLPVAPVVHLVRGQRPGPARRDSAGLISSSTSVTSVSPSSRSPRSTR